MPALPITAPRSRPVTSVFIEGELVYREYDRTIETDNGPVKVQWPVTEIVIESVSVINRKDREERKGAA